MFYNRRELKTYYKFRAIGSDEICGIILRRKISSSAMPETSAKDLYMFYKPSFCCNCGEKIERTDSLSLIKSGRFCDVCEKEFSFEEWLPKVFIAVCGLFGIFGIGSFLIGGETVKPAALKQSKNIVAESNVKTEPSANKPQNINQQIVQKTERKTESEPGLKTNINAVVRPKADNERVESEKIYFCGAATKKGTPCSRKVKGGGRCWQHSGQEAILPPEKLLITQ